MTGIFDIGFFTLKGELPVLFSEAVIGGVGSNV